MEEHEAGLLTECCDLLNSISNYPENKKCFDCCDNYSPRYLCTTFSTFVCSCCANIHHKEFGHSIKVLSVFSFTLNEIYVLKETGNRVAADKWLARWRSDLFMEPDPTSPTYKEDARKYMKAKYVEKRWVKRTPALPLHPWSDEAERDAEEPPRGYEDVSPRKVLPDGAVPVELTVSQQHDDKSVIQPTYAAPIMYLPQPMYIPVSMPPGMAPGMPQMPMVPTVSQYGFSQYHVPSTDMSMLPLPPPPQPYHYGALYTYPYDNMHCYQPGMIAEGVSWPGASKPKKKRPVTGAITQGDMPQQFTAVEELPAAHPGAIFRSVSDNSIVTHYVLQQVPSIKKESSMACLDGSNTIQEIKQPTSDSDTKTKTNPNKANSDTKIHTVSKSDSKLRLSGIMNKVAGFLGKKS